MRNFRVKLAETTLTAESRTALLKKAIRAIREEDLTISISELKNRIEEVTEVTYEGFSADSIPELAEVIFEEVALTDDTVGEINGQYTLSEVEEFLEVVLEEREHGTEPEPETAEGVSVTATSTVTGDQNILTVAAAVKKAAGGNS